MLSWGDLNCFHLKALDNEDSINEDSFDIWRELKYYTWVKDIILKRKISPNFIAPILYKIDSNSQIDWNTLTNIKLKYISKQKYLGYVANENLINNQHEFKDLGLSKFFKKTRFNKPSSEIYEVLKSSFIKSNHSYLDKVFKTKDNHSIKLEHLGEFLDNNKITVNNIIDNLILYLSTEKLSKTEKLEIEKLLYTLNNFIKDDLTADSGRSLVLLTEAPTTSLMQWMCPVYNSYGAIKKMISTGYYSPNIWKSIIFQLIYICAILQHEGFLFDTMTLEHNFYIKDVNTDPNNIGYWVYKIDDISSFYLYYFLICKIYWIFERNMQ
jgi:hypothetical protein